VKSPDAGRGRRPLPQRSAAGATALTSTLHLSAHHEKRQPPANEAGVPALVSTLHDPEARLLAALSARAPLLAHYAHISIRATSETDTRLLQALRAHGAAVTTGPAPEPGAGARIGEARREALRAAFVANHQSFFYCDFDRWLHWAGSYAEELLALPTRIAARRPRPWYVILGRTARAFATHPSVQQVAERATNRALSLAVGRRLDATAGACWLSREGAEVILRKSTELTNATDLEWPALIYRAAPRRLAYLANEGLEFETAEFFAAEVMAAGGVAQWQRRHYDQPRVWRDRLRLAADSVAAACRVLTG